jgi:hypothetical protein
VAARSAAERLLGSWVRITPAAWMFVFCTVFVLSGRGLCDGPIPGPERVLPTAVCVWVWSSENKTPLHLPWTSTQKREGLWHEYPALWIVFSIVRHASHRIYYGSHSTFRSPVSALSIKTIRILKIKFSSTSKIGFLLFRVRDYSTFLCCVKAIKN